MFYTYVLKSLRNGKRYVGSTSKGPELRLAEHNSGNTTFTRQNRPFELVYFESFDSKKECTKRELFFKSGQGRKYLDKHIPA